MASASARPKVGADDTTKQRLLQAAEKFESIKGDVRLYLEVDVCLHYAPEALVGHQVRVFWPGDDAWYLARVTSYNPAIAEHAFDYDDGVHEEVVVALHRIRVPLRPSTPLPTLSPADLRTYADSLRARARKPGIKAAERKKLSQRAGELNDAADSLEAGPSDTPAASSGAQEHAAEYFPGDVVWGKVNGYPDWPALVTTRTHAQGDRPMQANRLTHGVPVCYFGTFERQILKRTSVTPFIEGVAAGFYAKTTSKKRKFAAAICEVATYLEDGELPEGMIPTNDDEDSDEELEAGEEEESVEDTRPAKKARRGRPSASAAVLPSKRKGRSGGGLLVGKSFRVLSLGRVEWIHPGYHNEKTIFPVGYRAEKVTVSPAGGPAPVPHLCEVLEGSDGAGPVFRVTPGRGKPPVHGPTPSKAWAALFADADTTTTTTAGAALSNGRSGLRNFGLSIPAVVDAIQALPNAARCERYAAWPDGAAPAVPPLSPEDQRRRVACEARLSRLPEGVLPVTAVPPRPGVCFVCLEEEEDDEDFILQCDRCKVYVHMDCYSVREPPHGRLWLCDVCSVGASPPPACALCPVAGGALKRTTCGRWCHPSCSLWLPEPALRKDLEYMGLHGLIDGLSLVHQSRGKLPCQVCKQRYGACVQCCNPGCYSAFHLMCARQQGCATQLLPDSDSEDEMEEAEWTESAQQTGQARASAARHASSGSSCKEGGQASEGSGDENREVPPNGAIAPETTEKVQEGRLGKKMSERAKKERRALRQQGVKINNARLLVFCPRHTPPELAGKESLFTRSPGAVDGCSAAPTRAGSGHVPANVPRGASQIAGAIASAGAVPSFEAMEFQRVLEQPGKGCARARCLRGAQRRGPREPQSLIAAASKRLYVSPAPLLLRGPEAGGAGGNSAGGNPLTEVRSACKVHQLAPVAQKPDGQGCMEVLAPSFRARGPAGAGVQVLSVGDRYHAMRRTEGQRIVPGKSGIHGWGAFARVPHAKDDMVIEYVGELVRPSVADARERASYDSLVGAGTYIFRLNMKECVDATRSGNLAHLLNHSCDPNCYSRTVSVWDDVAGRAVDHVVIFALKRISAGEELTYDYRFCGEEQLTCNCGAAKCRGMVNAKPPSRGLLVPRSQVKPYVG